jgi:hypothetical protein
MTSIEKILQGVVGTGEIITLAYNGGSRPGQARQVVPISLSNQKLVAVEPATHLSKHYKTELIAWIELSSGEHISNSEAAPPPVKSNIPTFDTLAEYAKHLVPELQNAGWHIYESETSFAVATSFKNGKPRKTPSVSIQYFDPTVETIFDFESGNLKTVPRKLTGREKPWRIDSWRLKQGRSFGQLRKAFEIFLEEARASDPTRAEKS